MAASADRAIVQVPATSANLGPGFDCLGLALQLYLRVDCRVTTERLRISVAGSEGGDISADESNVVYRAAATVYDAAGQAPPGMALHIDNGIPLSRGLGSSAAAACAGLMLGNALLGSPFTRERLLEIGLPLEGHPDNLAPALFGGLTVSGIVDADDGAAPRVLTVPVTLPHHPAIVLFIPDFAMSTQKARRVLPASVPRADAVFNTGRSSLLVAALASGNLEALRWAMEDRLHQPYRTSIFPALPRLIGAALAAGAAGAALSGAGSTVIAFCDEASAPDVAAGLEREAASQRLAGRSVRAGIDSDGARMLEPG